VPGLVSFCPECGRPQLLVIATKSVLLSRGVFAHDVETAHMRDVEVFLAAVELAAEDPDAVVLDLRRGPARCRCGDLVRLKDLGALARLELAPGVVQGSPALR